MSETSKRPSYRDQVVIEAAVDKIIADVAKWANNSVENIRPDLVRCIEHNGYLYARQLDDMGWEPDAELVGILEAVSLTSAREKLTREWVRANGIKVPNSVGDIVTLRHKATRVVAIKEDTAEIIVQPIDEDCTRFGATGGWVHPFEDARLP